MSDLSTKELVERLRGDARALLLPKMGFVAKDEVLDAIPDNLRAAAMRLTEMEEALKPFAEARLVFWDILQTDPVQYIAHARFVTDPSKAYAAARALTPKE